MLARCQHCAATPWCFVGFSGGGVPAGLLRCVARSGKRRHSMRLSFRIVRRAAAPAGRPARLLQQLRLDHQSFEAQKQVSCRSLALPSRSCST